MPTEKRQRQKQGRQLRVEQQRVAEKRSSRTRQIRGVVLVLVAVLGVALLISIFSGGGGDDDVATDDGTATDAGVDDGATDEGATDDGATDDGADVPDLGEPVEVVLPGPGAEVTGETPCPAEDGSAERTTGFESPPPTCIDSEVTYQAVLETTEGTITLELDADAAPETVNNFVVLARYGFYDGVPFHRIIPGFMNQAGDPVGPQPGTGGPGYTIPDELPEGDDPYPEGTLAMANTGAPDSGGSQFFIVIAEGGQQLTPTYSVFGRVVDGIDVARTINELGDPATNGTPIDRLVTIDSVTIVEA